MLNYIGTMGNLRLRPLGQDESFFDQLLFAETEIKPSALKKRSQEYMYSAKQEFSALSTKLTTDEVIDRIKFIQEKVEALVFNVESQAQAVKMFSIINDRGLPLRILDKTKSILMLYSTLHLSESLNDFINDAFEVIFDSYDDLLVCRDDIGILGRLEENTIFTHHYYSARHLFQRTWNNRDGADTIFDNIKSECERLKDDQVQLTSFIRSYVEDFKEFTLHYSKLINEVTTKVIYDKPFRFLEFTATLYPLIVRLYMNNQLDRLLHILEITEVRVYKLRGTNPIADMYSLSSHVASSNPSTEEVEQSLVAFNEKFVNNHVFGTYLDDALAGNGAVKYLLTEFSNANLQYTAYKDLQVEHIFSRNPNFDVKVYLFGDDYDYEKNKIGNLTLLESELNDGLSNQAPINKVTGYLQSSIGATRELGGAISGSEFNRLSVEERQQRIIDFCIQRFSLNGH